MNPITLEFRTTFAEAYVGMAEYVLVSPLQCFAHSIFPLAGLVILGLMLWGPERTDVLGVVLVIGCFLFGPGLVALALWLARRRNRLIDGTQSVTFRDDAIQLAGPLYSTDVSWKAVVRAVESRNWIFLFISAQGALTVPKKAMANEGQLLEIRDLIGSKLGDRARLRTSTTPN